MDYQHNPCCLKKPTDPTEAIEALLVWFAQNKEDYFFRRDKDPYLVWLAEVSLQQTQIKTALPKLERFYKLFPNIYTLAEATEQEVLQGFAGLGYYNRARNLRYGAQQICERYNGKLPDSVELLLKIPSIGSYTAAAIASICFQQPVAAVDGNIKRVVARLLCIEQRADSPALAQACRNYVESIMVGRNPGQVNEALMELGQKICTRSIPLCDRCPLRCICNAFALQKSAKLPLPSKKKKPQHIKWHSFLLRQGKNFLLENWKDFYFLKDHKAFPAIIEFLPQNKCISSWGLQGPDLGEILDQSRPFQLGYLSHSITHHKIKIFVYFIDLRQQKYLSRYFQEQNNFPSQRSVVSEQSMDKILVASAMLKVWTRYLQWIS